MKNKQITIICFIMIIMEGFGQNIAAKDSDVVWEAEKRYWKSIEKKDLKRYSAMLHPGFSDWPAFTRDPIVNRSDMETFVDEIFKNHQSIKVNLTPKHIKLSGKYGIVYFTSTVVMIDRSGLKKEETFTMLHIWHKHNNRWLLLGGMQCKR